MVIEASLETRRQIWLALLFMGALLLSHRPATAGALPTDIQPISVPLASGPNGNAEGAMRMVSAILEYTRWPTGGPNLTLCVVAPTLLSSRMERMTLSGGRTVSRRLLPADQAPGVNGCDALYLGRRDQASLKRWTRAARGNAVVTIAEHDPACGSEAMFCLRVGAKSMSFDMNIDAVSRSAVRIDPRVLRLSQGGQ